ncbi:GNAT family N-acetyltransferase [Aquihabitans sp. G128]|uniref:GNAT family N-acetyltransferase n=1 Tax=Aquihabitans sp. G128 TaxID=2849779 RepID=UPI001C20F7B8|nr:GNAT family N-acetyltransferase [Aquihabitans sp. G128]QXC62331.1 GNAT family N-acetyltransferase [Aquihabitans sp. G128]
MLAVRRIRPDEGPVLRATRLAALADAPGESTTTLARAQAHDDDHWTSSAAANASGPLQATFFAEADEAERAEPIGLVGAYANRSGVVNLVGLWSAPGYRDIGVATALIDAVAAWAVSGGHTRLRLWVVERNEYARRFYEQAGFSSTGTSMPYEPDPRISQVEMVLEL